MSYALNDDIVLPTTGISNPNNFTCQKCEINYG
jgi:hypothetical protein